MSKNNNNSNKPAGPEFEAGESAGEVTKAGDAKATESAVGSDWPVVEFKTPAGGPLASVRLAPGVSPRDFANHIYGGHLRPRLGKAGQNPVIVAGQEIECLVTDLTPVGSDGLLTQGACKAVVMLAEGCPTIHHLCGLILEDKVALA